MQYDVVIIGAGLGGLECAYILAKNGLKVCILEKSDVIGGALQSFKRAGTEFDTGFHYVGGIEEGQSLYPLFKYFNLLHLPWHKLDTDCFDKIVIDGRSFRYANGYKHFTDTLAEDFPSQKDSLRKFVDVIASTAARCNAVINEPTSAYDIFSDALFSTSTRDYLYSCFSDKLLIDVIAGSGLKIDITQKNLPFFIFAEISNAYIQSAYRLGCEGSAIVESLSDDVKQMGGEIFTKKEVVSIAVKDGKACGVTTTDGDFYESDWIVSDVHPAVTISFAEDSFRNIYKRRIRSHNQTLGMFTVNIKLKKDTLPYRNYNEFIYDKADMWSFDPDKPVDRVMVSYHYGKPSLDLMTPMSWKQVEQWADTSVGKRGAEYEAFKARKVQECFRLVPEITDAVESFTASTPLTWHDYTSAPEGGAYGISKDCTSLSNTMLSPVTPIPNLILTGQNLNIHGVMGVSMTSVLSCNRIIKTKII